MESELELSILFFCRPNSLYIDRDFFHDSLLDVYQWIYELRCKIAVENYICQQDYKQKEKIPCNVLLSKIHGL